MISSKPNPIILGAFFLDSNQIEILLKTLTACSKIKVPLRKLSKEYSTYNTILIYLVTPDRFFPNKCHLCKSIISKDHIIGRFCACNYNGLSVKLAEIRIRLLHKKIGVGPPNRHITLNRPLPL